MTARLVYTGTSNDDLALAYCAACDWSSRAFVRFPKGYTVDNSGIVKATREQREHNSEHHLCRYSLTVTAPVEYVDRTLQTASWWDRYEIQPGTYEIHFEDYNGREVDGPTGAAYWKMACDAVLVESYRVNRVFTASSSETTTPNEPTTLHRSGHAFFMDTDKYDEPRIFGLPVTVERV